MHLEYRWFFAAHPPPPELVRPPSGVPPMRLCVLAAIAVVATVDATTTRGNKPRLKQVYAFTLGNTINGGLVGALGPSVASFQSSTGLSQAGLARSFMINRLAKLVGTAIWAEYASRLERGYSCPFSPRTVLVSVMLLETVCSLLIVCLRSSARSLQVALAAFGLCYGLADSGFDLLTVWSETADTKATRTHVALLNAGFTAGAILTPAVVGLAIKLGGSSYTCFLVLAALSALTGVAISACDMLADGVPVPVREEGGGDDGDMVAERTQSRPDTSPTSQSSLFFVACMFAVLFCATGSEHVVGTWLPCLGADKGGLSMAAMAGMSSFFWATICAGRIGWVFLSTQIQSGWPVLAASGGTMMLAGALYVDYVARHGTWQLWLATFLLGLGCSSSLPCALTMPMEAQILLTPSVLMCLNLAGTVGEMVAPFLVGLALQQGVYRSLGLGVVGMMVVMGGASSLAWSTSRRVAPATPRTSVVCPISPTTL